MATVTDAPTFRLVVMIPTRNRSELAVRGIESTVSERLANAHILVSDNSSDEHHMVRLKAFCSQFDPTVLTYVRPPADMSMTDHWQWMFEKARERRRFSHYTILTDRAAYKRGGLRSVVENAAIAPQQVLAYRFEDFVADHEIPIRIGMHRYSQQIATVPSRELLDQVAQMHFPEALPKLLNCVVPDRILSSVEQRFGSILRGTVAPDVGFAFRCLSVVDEIRFLDSSPVVPFGLGLSNGHAWSVGRQTAATAEFASAVPDDWVSNTYVPGLRTCENGAIGEYESVAAVAKSDKFKPIDYQRYLEVNAAAVLAFESQELRETSLKLLSDSGWKPSPPGASTHRMKRLRSFARNPVRKIHLRLSILTSKVTCSGRSLPLWRRVARLGWYPTTTSWFTFESLDDALSYALVARARKSRKFSYDPP